jgi:hypothetical protein
MLTPFRGSLAFEVEESTSLLLDAKMFLEAHSLSNREHREEK